MRKPTKRKAFSFLRSYFDVLNELENDKDKLAFLLSVINKQFLDQDPKDLNFVVNLCYESQRHIIEKSVKGYKDKTKKDLLGNPLESISYTPTQDPCQGGTEGGCQDPYQDPYQDPCQQEKEKEKEEEQEKEKNNNKKRFSFLNSLIEIGADEDLAKDWLKVRKDKKASNTETAFKTFSNQVKKSKYNVNQILTVCVSESWKGYKSSWDLSTYIDDKPILSDSKEEIIVFRSNVNPEVKKLLKNEFLKLKEKTEKGGYKYEILN